MNRLMKQEIGQRVENLKKLHKRALFCVITLYSIMNNKGVCPGDLLY